MPVTDPRRRSTVYRRRLSEIKLMQKLVTEETLDSTREMLRLFDQSQDAGVRTLELLHHQGEQLGHVGGDLDNMNVDLSKANRDLKQIELAEEGWVCCAFCCCCRRKKKVKNSMYESSYSELTIGGKAKVSQNVKNEKPEPHYKEIDVESDSGLTDDQKIDRNLTSLFEAVSGLKSNAKQIGRVVTTQNSFIDLLNRKAETDQTKLTAANKRIGRLV